MWAVEPVEYNLTLSTGEVLKITEINTDSTECLKDPKNLSSMEDILKKCTYVKHSILEEAKRGYTKNLEKSLKTPPVGNLLKINNHICKQIKDCPSADVSICTTRNVHKKLGSFPDCFEYMIEPFDVQSSEVARQIIYAWKSGRYVLLILPD